MFRLKLIFLLYLYCLLIESTMKVKACNKTSLVVVATLLTAVFLANGLATYFGYNIIVQITKSISVIAILTLYYCRLNAMANVFLTIFLLFLLGDLFSVFRLEQFSRELSKTFFMGSYLMLIFVLLGKIKRIRYEGLVSIYLIFVLLLNAYLLYVFYDAVKGSFTDEVNLALFIGHGIMLIAMSFFAFAVYLSNETTQSIVFLVMVFCFVFSDVLNYICELYVYYWAFEFFGNMLHLASLVLFYVYVHNHHKIVKVKAYRDMNQEFVIQKSERLTA